jgi:hypothetical protein
MNNLYPNPLSDVFAPSTPILLNNIENEIKVIYYKFLNNTLLLNHQIARFDPDTSPNCNYCSWNNPENPRMENINHWLEDCTHLTSIRTHFLGVFHELDFDTNGNNFRIELINCHSMTSKNIISGFSIYMFLIYFLTINRQKFPKVTLPDAISYVKNKFSQITEKYHIPSPESLILNYDPP